MDAAEVCGENRNFYDLNIIGGYASFLLDGVGSWHGFLPHFDINESGASLICYSNINCGCFDLITPTCSPLKEDCNIQVYPNPVTNGYLAIEFDANFSVDVEIFDLTGRQHLFETINQTRQLIDCNDLPNGAYLIKMKGKTFQKTQKIWVQKN